MSILHWQRYDSPGFDITRALKVVEKLGRTVLFARWGAENDNDGIERCYNGDFIVGEKYAEVCTDDMQSPGEDLAVLIGDGANFSWEKCYGGYVPRYAVCIGRNNDEPSFLGRVDVNLDETGKPEDFRGGFIWPSNAGCLIYGTSSGGASVSDTDGETGRAQKNTIYYKYEVLQIKETLRTSSDALPSFVIERMDEGKVLSELEQLYQLRFHGTSQQACDKSLSKLWANSGLDTDFFFPQALPWLLDLAQIHGLPTCLRQCLHRRLEAIDLEDADDRRMAIKLVRLFKYSATDGFHYKFGTTERQNTYLFHDVKLPDQIKWCFDRATIDQLEGITTGQRPQCSQPMLTALHDSDESKNVTESGTRHDMKSEKKEKLKPKSLFSKSNANRRAPVPHSVMVQKCVTDSDFGIQVATQDEQMLAELELRTLTPSELLCYEKQAEIYLEDASCTEGIAEIVRTLLAACQGHRETGVSEAAEESAEGQVEENQLIKSSVQVTSLYEIFSALLTKIGGGSAGVSTFLYPLLELHIRNGWGGTLTAKEMLDLLEAEEFKTEVVPNELKGLLAESLMLSLYNHLEDGELISIPHYSTVEETVLDFVLTQATTNHDFNLLLYIMWILSQSPTTPEQLHPTIFPKLTEFLKYMTEEEFLQDDSTVISILRLIQFKCRTYSTDTIQVIGKYLEGGSSQAGRTFCAQWLKRAATDADMCLDEKTLTILRNSLDDPNPCIKYNARAAFAAEIKKQMSQWTSETFPHVAILSEIIATEPIILILAGQKPEYFTHSINLPILQILNYYQIEHGKSTWKVTKSIVKLFGKGSRPQESLSKGWEAVLEESLRYLGEQEYAIPAAVFEGVDKVFVEQDNCSVLPACAEFISKRVKRGLMAEHATLSPQFLEQVCRRLRLSRLNSERHVYLECLHMLREWQELPDDIFQIYHIEAGVARLLSVMPNSKEEQPVSGMKMGVPPNEKANVTEGILGWFEIYLRRGFLLSRGIIDAYESTITSVHQTPPSINAGLTAAAISGQVIPENILSKVLHGFPSSPMDHNYFELARACLQNQSLPNQVLIQTLRCLCQAERCVKSESPTEACLIIICSAYVLNRKLLTVSEIQTLFSESGIGGFVSVCEKRELQSSNETIILSLFKKFPVPESDSNHSFDKTTNLFSLAKELAEKNTERDAWTRSTVTSVEPSRTMEEQELWELITNAKGLYGLWDIEACQRFFRTLRSKSTARKVVKLTLMALESSRVKEYGSEGTEVSSAVDSLELARAAFISMVTSSTEDAAEECREILELICTKFVKRDVRLASVVGTLERLQKLGIKLFACVDRLMTAFSEESRADRLNQSRRKLEELVGRSPSFFSPLLDNFEFSDRWARWQEDRKDSYLREGDLLEELLLVALRKDFVPESISTARLSETAVEILLQTCLHTECFKYNCHTSLLIECVREHITRSSTLPSGTIHNEQETAVTDLVYVSVISSITKLIREKIPNQDGAAGFLGQSKNSLAALAAELLEAFHYNLPRLNLFLSKLSAVNTDSMWYILPYFYNPQLDLNNIHDDNYETEVEAEYLMMEWSSDWEPSMKTFVAAGLRYLLRQSQSVWHLIVFFDHFVETLKAAMRVSAYKMDPFNLETVQLVRSPDEHQDPRKYLVAVNEHIQKIIRNKPQVILSQTELLSNVKAVEGKIGPLTLSDLLTGIKNVVSSGDGRSIRLGNNKKTSVGLLTLRDIKEWANYVRRTEVDLTEAICVVNKAVNLWRLWDLTTEQILAIFLGLSQSKDRNLFLELSTGSGKSVVIAVIAVIKALRGNKVDIFTSNHLLARRDAQAWEEFYSFFNLSCSSNGDEAVTYVDGPRECYNKDIDIVYGDIKQFQFDALRAEFMGLGTRSGRTYEDVIIDEVDSILLDDGPKLAMLSTAFTGMDKLEPVYHLIRFTLISLDSDQTYYSFDGDLYVYKGDGEPTDGREFNTLFDTRREYLKRNIEAFIRTLLRIDVVETETFKIEEYFQLPSHLLNYARSQVSNWADAAILAQALEENKDYLLVDNKVVPIDPHTGVLQESSNWGNGLHQFLQIKHEVDFTPESLTTNYLSNWAMVQKYKHGIVGLTGTLGSTEAFHLLSQHMSADCVSVPNRVLSRFVEFPNIIVRTRREWREAIVDVTETEISVGRAVLVICQTVKEARTLHRELDAKKNRVKLHDRSDTWMEHHLQQVQPADVIVTTNLGTRGMDIQASAIESAGGLHVVLAYMPPNTRIVKQAFGRTARKGNAGSGQFIIKQKYGTLDTTGVLEYVKKSEIKALDRYFKDDLRLITLKDKIFSDFVLQYSKTREEVKKLILGDEKLVQDQAMNIASNKKEFSGTARIVLEAIQEAWAAHLKTNMELQLKANKFSNTTDLKHLLNETWKSPHLLFKQIENCYHPTRYGFQLYRKLPSSKDPESAFYRRYVVKGFKKFNKILGSYNEIEKSAFDYLKLATKLAPEMSPAAHVGIAYVLLKTRRNLPNVGDYGLDHKINALNYLRKAIEMLGKEIGYYRGCRNLLSNPSTSRLSAQLMDRTRALEAYATVVEETCRTVEFSLRPIEVTYERVMDDTTHVLWVSDGNATTAAELKQTFGVFDTEHEIHLAFHGLKANKDLGHIYQAEDGVKLLYDSLNLPNLKGRQPTVSLGIDSNGIQKVFDIFDVSAFGDFSDRDEDPDEDMQATEKSSLDVSSSFTLEFSSMESWDDVMRTANTLRYKENPRSYIVLRAAKDVIEKLQGSQDDSFKPSSAGNTESISDESIPIYSETANSPPRKKWKEDLTMVTKKLQEIVIAPLAGFFDSRESCCSVSRKNISRQSVPSYSSKLPVELETVLTICTGGLRDPASLFDALISNSITFHVVFEGVHLEDDEVAHRSRSILEKSARLAIHFPKLRLAEDMRKMAEEMTASVRSYCKMFGEKGVTPTLEFRNLDSSLAELLFDNVNRVSDPFQQLNLVPLRDVKFRTAPSSEAFRRIDQEGLFLVATFVEQNAIPQKATALVSAVAAGELIVGGILCGLGVPWAGILIKMALKDAITIHQIHQKREFSLVEFVVKKAIKAVKTASGEVIDGKWVSSFFSSLGNARPDEVERIVIKQWAALTPSAVFQAGSSAAASVFFLYLKYGGQKTIVKAIKERMKTITSSLKMPAVDDDYIKKLWASFQAVVSTGLNRNPDDELKNWFHGLTKVDLWGPLAQHGVKVVDWTSLQHSVGTETNFGACLLQGIEKVVEQNANIYVQLGCVKIIKELKAICFKLCIEVLEKHCRFAPHEVETVSSQVSPKDASPVSEIRKILGTQVSGHVVEENRLKVARRKFQEIAESKARADLSFNQDALLQIHEYLMKRLQSSESVVQLIQHAVSTTFEETKTAKIIPSPSPENIVLPSESSHWEDGLICRLMEKVSEISAAEYFCEGSFEDSSSAQLASLINYLHEKRLDAALLRPGVYEELRARHDGDFGVPFVIVYQISPHDRLLEPLKVVREKTERTFTGPDLVLKALNYICGDSIEDILSFESMQRSTEKGTRIRACLRHLINVVLAGNL